MEKIHPTNMFLFRQTLYIFFCSIQNALLVLIQAVSTLFAIKLCCLYICACAFVWKFGRGRMVPRVVCVECCDRSIYPALGLTPLSWISGVHLQYNAVIWPTLYILYYRNVGSSQLTWFLIINNIKLSKVSSPDLNPSLSRTLPRGPETLTPFGTEETNKMYAII